MQDTRSDHFRNEPFVAIIGDVVKLRELGASRSSAQEELRVLLQWINENLQSQIASKFLITVGDEFQGLLKAVAPVQRIISKFDTEYRFAQIRFGIGLGIISTEVTEYSIGMDGPAWYNAREAISFARKHKLLGGYFRGFETTDDKVLNGLSRELNWHRSKWTDNQREVIFQLENGRSQQEIANAAGSSKQLVSRQVHAAGWQAYSESKEALYTFATAIDNRSHRSN